MQIELEIAIKAAVGSMEVSEILCAEVGISADGDGNGCRHLTSQLTAYECIVLYMRTGVMLSWRSQAHSFPCSCTLEDLSFML